MKRISLLLSLLFVSPVMAETAPQNTNIAGPTASATGNRIAVVPFNATGAVSSANQGQTINRSTSSTHPAGTYAAIFSTTNNVYAYNYSGSTLSTPASGTGNFQFSYYTNS